MKFSPPGSRKRARIEIIPLIDVMFFLLASFIMVSLQMQKLHKEKERLMWVEKLKHPKKTKTSL